MTDQVYSVSLQPFPWNSLAPYMSVVVLRCIADDPSQSFGAVHRYLAQGPRQSTSKTRQIVAEDEFRASSSENFAGLGTLAEVGLDQVSGFIRRVICPPSWADDTVDFVDTTHDLCILLRRGDLLAVKVEDGAVDRLQRWLDKAPLPGVRRIAPAVLGYTFLMGETRGLWLQGAHNRTTLRPDAKTSVGMDLRDTIDPFDDSSFSLGSARAQLPSAPNLVQLKGAIGTTMKTSQLWLKQMPDFPSFLGAVVEVFELIEKASKDETQIVEAFPQLAREVDDLTEVFGAYEVSPVDLDTMPTTAVDEETREASTLLKDAVLTVQAGSNSANFKLNVGLNGCETGTISVRPSPIPHGFKLEYGFHGEPSVLAPTRQVLNALEIGDMLTVYYESGHVYSRGRISARNTYIASFPRWNFQGFISCDGVTPCDIEMEKPFNLKSTREIHRRIGDIDDVSLFGWVSKYFSDGWLICDDGSGETADFLQVSTSGVLRIIHVKGAESRSPNRQISARAYEVVASQASKNLIYLNKERLIERLAIPPTPDPACWEDGVRTDSRSDFIEILRATTNVEIIVVQPHVNESLYHRVKASPNEGRPSANILRLQLLETLLNSARASIVKSGAEFSVIGSKFP